MRFNCLWLLLLLGCQPLFAQNHLATYAGGSGKETFNDVIQLSNGHILVIGVADNLDWLAANTPRTQLSHTGISNNQGSGRYAFICAFDSSLQTMLHVYHLPAGAAEDFRFIKTTNVPGEPTGAVYLSGTTEDSSTGGYFIGRLDNNFVEGQPTGFVWVYNVNATAGDYPKIYQPWDVGSDGSVVFATGDSHDYNWSAVYRLNAAGERELVDGWRVHWKVGGGEYYGAIPSFPAGPAGLLHSGIVFKRDANRCELRSTNAADYHMWQPDGNGGMKKGRWPLDVLFRGPCNPGQPGNNTSGPGYTGYSPPGTFTYGPSSIVIDRRTNHMFIGFNFKSVLPDGNPDFEPTVMAMDADGYLRWWSRLYHEVQPVGDTVNSSPDQYIDALAIDYARPPDSGTLVVQARCHGNNWENLWEGDQIAANISAMGFQNRFTGSNGNIHISWLGKLTLNAGTLLHSTYVAEYAEGTTGLGAPHPDPRLDGWPNPNAGWPNVNTTFLAKNMLKVTASGAVVVLGKGRRTITTTDAFQKMVKPNQGGLSCWNDFVRQYEPDLSVPAYSSLVVGQWDTLTQQGGDNIRLHGMFKTAQGILVVGRHLGSGQEMPTVNVPAWGNSSFNGESAVLVYHRTAGLYDPGDSPVSQPSFTKTMGVTTKSLLIFPNPADGSSVTLRWSEPLSGRLRVFNPLGLEVRSLPIQYQSELQLDTSSLGSGLFWLRLEGAENLHLGTLLIPH